MPERLLNSWLLVNAGQPAFTASGITCSRLQLHAAAQSATSILSRLGLARGDALALWLPDGALWLQMAFAAAQMGVLVIPVSTRYRASEVKHLLEVSKAAVIVTVDKFLGVEYGRIARELKAELPSLRQVLSVSNANAFLNRSIEHPDESRSDSTAADRTAILTDACFAFSTSGTTGFPKLAVHDQGSVEQHARFSAKAFDIRAGDTLLCALPFYGVYGLISTLAALAAGAHCVLLPVFEAQAAADAIAQHRITHLFGSDASFSLIFDVPDANLASLRVGGLADFVGLSARVVTRAEEQFGITLCGLYGSSECFALTAMRPIDQPIALRSLPGGTPISDQIEFRIVDPADGRPLADGEPGELQLRGYCVLSNYLNNPSATQRALTHDGWFRSGDLCERQGGSFRYRSRLDDSLRLRGYLVDPSEIEACLMSCAGVQGVQVVGVHRQGEGDIAIAFVIRQRHIQGYALDEASVIDYCRSSIAAYKAPKFVVFVDEFPTVNGPNGSKIQKTQLRERANILFRN